MIDRNNSYLFKGNTTKRIFAQRFRTKLCGWFFPFKLSLWSKITKIPLSHYFVEDIKIMWGNNSRVVVEEKL